MEQLLLSHEPSSVEDEAPQINQTIAFGCEHLEKMMSRSNRTSERFQKAFSHLQKYVFRLPAIYKQTTNNYKFKTKTSPVLRSTYLCTQCSSICRGEGIKAHSCSTKHVFSVESRSGFLYCARCDDFVYDPELERIRGEIQATCKGRRKKKLDVMLAPPKVQLSTPVSCHAGAPRGLYNLGQTCYLSVILQAMAHNPFKRAYFQGREHRPRNCAAEKCLGCALRKSIREIWTTDETEAYAPVDLLHRSWQNCLSLAGYAQQDAHEYFQFLINSIHDTSIVSHWKRTKDCPCISHQTFASELRSTVTCLECGAVTVSSDPIIDLSLDIHGSAGRARSSSETSQDSSSTAIKAAISASWATVTPAEAAGSTLNLTTCLLNFTVPERLLVVDGYVCVSAQCKNTPQPVAKQLTLNTLPPTLCIHLKRYQHAGSATSAEKLSTRVAFPLQLDMSPYTTHIQHHISSSHSMSVSLTPSTFATITDPDPDLATTIAPAFGKSHSFKPPPVSPRSPLSPSSKGWYDLSSVVVHLGTMQGGHYIIFCKRGGQWLRFDDHKVTVVGETAVLAVDPYLLFYVTRGVGERDGGSI